LDFSKHLAKADEALKRKKHDYAIELYRQLIDLDPDLGEARGGLRRALKARHEHRGGGRLLRAVSGAVPLGRAMALRKLKKYDACARALEDYLVSSPLDEQANLTLGLVLEEAGHLKAARAVYEFVAEIAPENPEGLKRAGAMMRQGGDTARALAYYERALEVDPRDREALKARKDLAAETAIRHTQDAGHSRELVREPEELSRLERSRRRHFSTQELALERERLEAELAGTPEDLRLQAELSDVCRRLGDLEQAHIHARRALSLAPDTFELVERVGDLETRILKRRLAEAEERGLGELAQELGGELRAHEVADYGRSAALRPTDPELALGLARRRVENGELDEAIACLQRVQDDPRIRPGALGLLARCFREKGIRDLAEKNLRAALEAADPGSDLAKELLYELGSLAESEGNPEEARSFFVRIFEIDIGYRDVALKMKNL